MTSQVNHFSKYKELTLMSGENMMVGDLKNNIAVLKNNMMIELNDNDITTCKIFQELHLCNNLGTVFQDPGPSSSVRNIKLKEPGGGHCQDLQSKGDS